MMTLVRSDVASLLKRLLVTVHGRHQEAIADRLVARFGRMFGLLDFRDLPGTELRWLEAMLPEVIESFYESQRDSAAFNSLFLAANSAADGNSVEFGPSAHIGNSVAPTGHLGGIADLSDGIFVAPDADIRHITAVLLASGPGSIKHRQPAPEIESMQAGLSNAAGAGVRLALDGGRSYSNDFSSAVGTLVGFQRVTDSDPCAFCALLASRGATYHDLSRIAATSVKHGKNDGLVPRGESAKVHGHCRCILVPVYKDKPLPLTGSAKLAETIWADLPSQSSWQAALREFRRRYDELKSSNPDSGVREEDSERRLMLEVDKAIRGGSEYEKRLGRLVRNYASR